MLSKSLDRIAAPFIAVAIWRLLPVSLIPSNRNADNDPEGRDPGIADQAVHNAGGPDHDRKING